ncbi:MAG: DUF4325 domain-containing protein [Patescibacteria group bacterium]|jgi:hypothetical protein
MEINDWIKIATDFSDHPGARYRKDGECSGEQFLEELLLPKFEKSVEKNHILQIDLNKVYGYPSSFISGSFGKLSVLKGEELVLKHIQFKSEDNPINSEKILKEIKNPKRGKV